MVEADQNIKGHEKCDKELSIPLMLPFIHKDLNIILDRFTQFAQISNNEGVKLYIGCFRVIFSDTLLITILFYERMCFLFF